MKRNLIKNILILLLVSIVVLSGCTENKQTGAGGEGNSSKEQVLNVAMSGEAQKLDPHFASPVNEVSIVQTIFNGLVRFPTGTVDFEKIEGDLAEKWVSNNDASQWKFNLKKGVQWQKGYGELTSEDVKWSFERVMDEKTGSPWKGDYENIKSIDAPDKYTVIFNLKQSDASFLLKVLNYHGGMIVNKKAIEDAGDKFMTSPVGTGPFVFEEYKAKDKAVLVKNKEYFRGEPKLDKVVFKIMTDPTAVEIAMDKGEIQLGIGITDQLWIDNMKQNKNLKLDFTDPPLLWGIYLNISKPPLDDIRIRQAIAHAIDIKTLVTKVIGKDVASMPTGPVPSVYFGSANVGAYEYNPEKAKELLKEAGYEKGLTLPKQYISTLTSYLDYMVYVQDQLKKVGIDMPLEQVDHSTYHANARKDLNNIVLYGYVRAPHADTTLTQFFYGPSMLGKPTAITNYSHYDKVDELIEKGRIELDKDKAKAIYKDAQEQIKMDYVFVPLVETKTVLVRRKEVNLGYNQNKIDGTMIYYYYIDENTNLVD
jgi:peptide/nickel transport system substrate-binding protein